MEKSFYHRGILWKHDFQYWTAKIEDMTACIRVRDNHDFAPAVETFDGANGHQIVFTLDEEKEIEKAMDKCLDTLLKIKHGSVWPTAKESINNSMKNFPTLFENRADVLSHLFFTTGNGCDWYKGRLVDTTFFETPGKYETFWEANGFDEISLLQSSLKALELLKDIEPEKHQKQYEKEARRLKERQKEQKRIKAIKNGTYRFPEGYGSKRNKIKINCYTDKYARIATIPYNVTDDWFEMAVTTLVLVKKRGKSKKEQELSKRLYALYEDKFGEKFTKTYNTLYQAIK